MVFIKERADTSTIHMKKLTSYFDLIADDNGWICFLLLCAN